GPLEGAAGKVRRDAPRARALLLDRLRLADENLLAAPRHAETGRREGADDVDVSDQPRHALLALVAEAAVRREAEDQLVRRRASPLDERDDDLADARFHRDGDIGEALHDLGPRRRAAEIDELQILGAAELLAKDLPAVDQHDDRVQIGRAHV